MRLALATLNVGGRSLHPKSRSSFLAACARWGCEFVEFTEPLAPCHHFWQKTFAPPLLMQYDRVLQLDADMMIRWNAPSPFEIVPHDHLGVVSSRQFTPPDRDFAVAPETPGDRAGRWISRHRTKCINIWAARMGMKPCHDMWHINGGLFLYSPARHADLFERLRGVGAKAGWTKWRLPEQAALSVQIANDGTPTTWLGHEWNIVAACQPIRPEHSTGYMQGYIYHFTGKQHRQKRISRTRWEPAPCDEIAARLPEEGRWAEVGVADGFNALGVLWQRPRSHATLVDQWAEASPRYIASGDLAARLTSEQWERVKERAVRLTKSYNPTVLRSQSTEAAGSIADKSLDLVYIDAEHTYEAVSGDIRAWLPKVKPGGWIGGHDYLHPMERKGRWGVARAADEAFGGRISTGACHTWWAKVQ